MGEVLKKKVQAHRIEIPNSGILFIGEARINPPRWIRSFFPDAEIDYEKLKVLNSYPSAVFLTKIDTEEGERVFAITFGGGWQMIEKEAIEDNFGLKTTLNLVNPKALKSIDKKNLALVQKRSRENIGKDGVVADFGIDIEQDLIQSIVGRSKDRSFGNTLSGKDSLHLSVEVNMNNLKEKLVDYYKAYNSDEYKNSFSWIDQIKEVSGKSLIVRLNEKMVSAIKEDELKEKIWLSIPDVINWEDVAGFKYGNNKKETLYPDLYLSDFKAMFAEENVDIDLMKRINIHCISSLKENNIYSWKVFRSVYAEMEDEGNKYILNNGKWYMIDRDFFNAVNEDYLDMAYSDIDLPNCKKDMNESQYIKWVGDNKDYACLDKVNMSYDGHSSIEFCDLFSKDNKIIYIKRYGGSLVFNNLFSQAVISGRLFLTDRNFRKKINSKLMDDYKMKDADNKKIDSSKYQIIFGVISSSGKESIEVPFFSKVSLRNARKMLEAFGYSVFMKKIGSEERGIN
jgi:uncharacterized protein (TIGR04141 family)